MIRSGIVFDPKAQMNVLLMYCSRYNHHMRYIVFISNPLIKMYSTILKHFTRYLKMPMGGLIDTMNACKQKKPTSSLPIKRQYI